MQLTQLEDVLDYTAYKTCGEIYYVVQRSDRNGYEVYKREGEAVSLVSDGAHPLPHTEARIETVQGRVTSETVPRLLAALGADPV